jgi:hypothetical protein
MGELLKAAEGNELRFRLRIELGGKEDHPQPVIDQINAVLMKIADEMRFADRG